MVWKYIFMKNNITGNKNSVSRKVKQLVTFDIIWISNKKTRSSSRIKFGTIPSKGGSKT
jgi:hypothetical protein